MRPHVFLATPCYGGVVTQGYMQSVVAMMQQAPTDGYDVTLALLGQDALITRSRNTLLAHFIASDVATHILFVDSDISFDPSVVRRLLAARKEVIAASYPLKSLYWDDQSEQRMRAGEPADTAALRYVGELCRQSPLPRDGDFAPATYVGTGFMLISRGAISCMIDAYPETRYNNIHAYGAARSGVSSSYALFDCMIDPETQTYLSEDFTFCHRWRAVGGQIWLDTRSRITHTGPTDFHGVPSTAFEAEPVRARGRGVSEACAKAAFGRDASAASTVAVSTGTS